jgi:hypothetical protein
VCRRGAPPAQVTLSAGRGPREPALRGGAAQRRRHRTGLRAAPTHPGPPGRRPRHRADQRATPQLRRLQAEQDLDGAAEVHPVADALPGPLRRPLRVRAGRAEGLLQEPLVRRP